MNTLHIGRISADEEITVGRSRRLAAIIALLFPAIIIAVLLANIFGVKFDIISLMEHPIFLMYLVPGTFATVWWCKRYTYPAIEALREGAPISLRGRVLHISGKEYIIDRDVDLKYDRSFIHIMNGDKDIACYPSFFIRIDESNSNISRFIEYS
jgi:hypothetical protein